MTEAGLLASGGLHRDLDLNMPKSSSLLSAFLASMVLYVGSVQRAIAQSVPDPTGTKETVTIQDQRLEAALKDLFPEALGVRTVECYDQLYKRPDGSTPQGIEFTSAVDKAQERIDAIHAKLGNEGYRAYRCAMALGDEPQKVCVLRATDQYDILRYECTNGANFNLTTDDIIAKLKAWDATLGLVITSAAHDLVEVRITNAPANWKSFAKEVYAFCPDVVDQGIGSVDALEDDLRTRKVLFLWWD